MILILTCVLVFLIAVYIRHITSESTKTLNKFPGPKPLPFLGNVLELSPEPDLIFQQVRIYAKKYSTYRFWNFFEATVNIVTADDAEQYFTHPRNLEKNLIYDFLFPWLGKGILTSNGDWKWKQRRKMLTPAFHFSILRVFFNTMVEHSEQFVKELENCTEDKIDITPVIGDTALKIICETAMGTTLKLEDAKHRAYMDAAYEMCEHMIYRINSPWFYSDYTFFFSPVSRKIKKCVKILDEFTEKVIKERERTFVDFNLDEEVKITEEAIEDVPKKKRHVMLDLLIKEKRNGNIDDEGIREEVNTFMFAGHDTSATTVTFSLLLIANHKEIQDKIYKEIKEVLGDHQKITMNDLQNMPYLEMCIKESLRYYPPIPAIARRLKEEQMVGDIKVPAGTEVLCHIYDVHHDPKHWPDPEKFDPERFLPENSKERHPFAFVPFSAGPRNCIGQKFGLLEVKCMLVSILRNFELEPVTKIEDMNLMYHVVLKHKGPIYVKFKKR